MKNVLLIDTTLKGAAVAITNHGESKRPELRAHALSHEQHAATGALATLTAKLLSQTKLTLAEIDVVSVSTGPGSFTGIKVGIAFAQGLQAGSSSRIQSVATSSLTGLALLGDADYWVLPMGRQQGLMAYRQGNEVNFSFLMKDLSEFRAYGALDRKPQEFKTWREKSGQLVYPWPEFEEFVRGNSYHTQSGDFPLVAKQALLYMGRITTEKLDLQKTSDALEPVYLRGSAPEEKKLKGT